MLLFGITVANTACDDWTDMEPKFQEDMTQSSLPEEYYAQLRAYKKTDHPVAAKWTIFERSARQFNSAKLPIFYYFQFRFHD